MARKVRDAISSKLFFFFQKMVQVDCGMLHVPTIPEFSFWIWGQKRFAARFSISTWTLFFLISHLRRSSSLGSLMRTPVLESSIVLYRT